MIKDLVHHGEKKGNEITNHAKDSLSDLYFGMNDLFGHLFKGTKGYETGINEFLPKTDIAETEKGIEIKLELPGVEEKEINVTVENNILTISGEKIFEEETRKKNYQIIESSYGKYERSFSLPEYAETDKISAKFKNGVLYINVPKAKPAPDKFKKITISKE